MRSAPKAFASQGASGHLRFQFGGGQALYDGPLTVAQTAFANNTAEEAGGGVALRAISGLIFIDNSTFSGNQVMTSLPFAAHGGGALATVGAGDVHIQFSTIVHNESPNLVSREGIFSYNTTVIISKTIVANNIHENCRVQNQGQFVSGGYNLEDRNDCRFNSTGDITNEAPHLGSVADNGGAMPTHALLPTSPATDHIDSGVNGCGTTVTVDQRGEGRPQDGRCDVGAYEAEQEQLTVTLSGAGAGAVTSDPAGIDCNGPGPCSEGFVTGAAVTLTPIAEAGSTFDGWSGDCLGLGPCVLTMDAPHSMDAAFSLQQRELSVFLDGNGNGSVASIPAGIDCGADCEETFDHGTQVTLPAAAQTGSTFSGWSGACAGASPCTLTITAVETVSASFAVVEQQEMEYRSYLPIILN